MKVIPIILLLQLATIAASAQHTYLAGSATESIDPEEQLFSLALAGYGLPREGRFSLEWVPVKEQGAALTALKKQFGKSTTGSTTAKNIQVVSPEDKLPVPAIINTTSWHNRKYALRADNTIWRRTVTGAWVKIARANGTAYDINVQQIAAIKGRLYAKDSTGRFYIARHCVGNGNGLKTTALAVRQQQQTVVLVALDLVGIDYSFATGIKNAIWRSRGIPPQAILINISHTHFAPVMQHYAAFPSYGQLPDSMYLRFVQQQTIKAIEGALKDLAPAELYFSRGVTHIGFNRSSPNKKTPYDSTVDVIEIKKGKGKRDAMLFLASCHPVFGTDGIAMMTITANYPGITRTLLAQKKNLKDVLFLQGCSGDINPRSDSHELTGTELAADILEIPGGNSTKIEGALSYALDTMNIKVTPWQPERIKQFKQEYSNKEGDVWAEKNVRWSDLMLQRYAQNKVPSTMPEYIQTINIGNWKLVGLSREVVTEYGTSIKALWPDKLVSVAGYCNDIASYLPAPSHVRSGVYEGLDSFFWYAQPALFTDTTLKEILQTIQSNNR